MSNPLQNHLGRVAAFGGDSLLVADRHAKVTWNHLTGATQAARDVFDTLGLPEGAAIGVLIHNRAANALAVLTILASGRCAVYFNGLLPLDKLSDDIAQVRPALLLGGAGDLTDALLRRLEGIGTAAAICEPDGTFRLSLRGSMPATDCLRVDAGSAIEIQTSGTTGAPKRIRLSADAIMDSMNEGVRSGAGAKLRIRRSPTLLFAPLGHAGGTFALLLSAFEARPTLLFERFRIDAFRAAIKEYKPRFVSLPPPMLRMVLDSDMDRDEMSCLLAVRSGTAPLDPATQQQFEDRFGVPVLITYGATEFIGALARWTFEDHAAFIATKRGSVGRISPGIEMRIVDEKTGEPLPAGEIGILEVRGSRIAKDGWQRTTDLASIDEDAFVFVAGRTDDAIIRGGFKVLANQVADVLNRHHRVYEAVVIGLPDARLGEIPVAVIEPKEGVAPPTPDELEAYAREHLIAYQVPARFLIVPRLPRTVSLKVSRPDVRALFAQS